MFLRLGPPSLTRPFAAFTVNDALRILPTPDIYTTGPHLIGTAGVEHADLGRANAAAGLVLADAIREVVVGGAKCVGAVVTHPRAASTGRDLKADAVIG